MNRIDIIRIACWRHGQNTLTSAEYEAALALPEVLAPTPLIDLLAVLDDATVGEAGKLFGYGEYIRRTEAALAAGRLAEVLALLRIGKAIIDMSANTETAIRAALAARTSRLVDVIVAERNGAGDLQWPDENGQQITVGTVTAADVDAALGR